jgi:hypothetical protein
MEDLARDQDDYQYLDGTRFRELAVKLATRHGLTRVRGHQLRRGGVRT